MDGFQLATNVVLASSLEEVLDRRVCLIHSTENLGGLDLPITSGFAISGVYGARLGSNLLVGLVNVVHSQDGQIPVVTLIAQGNARTLLDANLLDRLLREIEGDRHTEEDAIGKTVLLHNTAVQPLVQALVSALL